MIILNLVHICDATSLHTSTQMAENGQSVSKWPILALFGVLQGLCAPPPQCNSSNVTKTTQCGNIQLGLHWRCNQPTYRCSNGPQMAKKTSEIANGSCFLASFWVGHAAYVHRQRHVTCPISLRKNGHSVSKWRILAQFGVLQRLCASPTQCNSFNVTKMTRCDGTHLGSHQGRH